ncbi:hypothetical protein HAX54_004603 [Datura stramonium]|uniref:Uncharacterized protein n=1 Tax=Datura stramonium TaxID=4076 RepID=A0ABS8WV28_DATST|nr:hypothetical protein [Datura stramonium]
MVDKSNGEDLYAHIDFNSKVLVASDEAPPIPIDVETTTNKKHDLNKSKDETRHDLSLYKLVPKVFRLNGKAQADIFHLNKERPTQEFPIPISKDSEEEDPFIDLSGKQPKSTGKQEGDEDDAKSKRNSQTIVTPYPAMEVAPDDTLSAPVTTRDTIDTPVVTTPQPIVPDAQA